MNYFAMGLMAVLAIGVSDVCSGAGLTFDTVEPVSVGRAMKLTRIKRDALERALELHNLMYDLRKMASLKREIQIAVQSRKLQEDRLAALEKCSINKMSEQFQNPQEVWNKMTSEYQNREKNLAIYVNSTKSATDEERQAFEENMISGKMSPEMVSETYASWRIGRDILMDVYQNQDKWGKRVPNADNTTFPLWDDQKYQFDQEWDRFYTQLNTYFGVPPQGRPSIGDERYDYTKAEQVKKAHDKYVALLVAQSPVKGAALAVEFKQPPIAPKPLPPKNEIMVYMNADTPEGQVYPSLPEPWQKYAENQFQDVAPQGEMAQDFEQGLTLKESAKYQNQANRLVAYGTYQKVADSARRVESLTLDQGNVKISAMQVRVAAYLKDDANVNLLDDDAREKVLAQLKKVYKTLLDDAEKEMSKRPKDDGESKQVPVLKLEEIETFAELKKLNPKAFEQIASNVPTTRYERDKTLLKALKTDMNGQVFLNEANAGSVEKIMREDEARTAFFESQDTLEKLLARSASQQIDDTCLNGGV